MNGPIAPLERRSLQFSSSYHDWFMPPFAAWLAVVSEQVSSYYFLILKSTVGTVDDVLGKDPVGHLNRQCIY